MVNIQLKLSTIFNHPEVSGADLVGSRLLPACLFPHQAAKTWVRFVV